MDRSWVISFVNIGSGFLYGYGAGISGQSAQWAGHSVAAFSVMGILADGGELCQEYLEGRHLSWRTILSLGGNIALFYVGLLLSTFETNRLSYSSDDSFAAKCQRGQERCRQIAEQCQSSDGESVVTVDLLSWP